MIITIHVGLPMGEAQGIKEDIAMRLEDMGGIVKVLEIRDDGYGKQKTLFRGREQEKQAEETCDLYPEAMAMVRKLQAEGRIPGGGTNRAGRV